MLAQSYLLTALFSIYDQRKYPISLIRRIPVLPQQKIIISVRIKIKNSVTVIFTSSKNFMEKRRILILHSLLKIEDGITCITMINANESPQYLNTSMIIGALSLPVPTSIPLPLSSTHQIETCSVPDLKYTERVVKDIYQRKNYLNIYAKLAIYSTQGINESPKQRSISTQTEIQSSVVGAVTILAQMQ